MFHVSSKGLLPFWGGWRVNARSPTPICPLTQFFNTVVLNLDTVNAWQFQCGPLGSNQWLVDIITFKYPFKIRFRYATNTFLKKSWLFQLTITSYHGCPELFSLQQDDPTWEWWRTMTPGVCCLCLVYSVVLFLLLSLQKTLLHTDRMSEMATVPFSAVVDLREFYHVLNCRQSCCLKHSFKSAVICDL